MTKLTYRMASIFALLALAGFVQAEDKEKSSCPDKGASAKCAAAECEDGKTCPISSAMQRLPKMSFAVGDEKIACPKAAGKIAQKTGAKVQFLVAGKAFAKKSDAKLALVEATEEYVNAFAKTKKCSSSGTITVAGKKLNCEAKASQTAKIVEDAMGKVKFTYLVGDKECHCPTEAKKVAKESGNKTLYLVGDKKTGCSVTARLNLARAKYKAAVKALARAGATTNVRKAGVGS